MSDKTRRRRKPPTVAEVRERERNAPWMQVLRKFRFAHGWEPGFVWDPTAYRKDQKCRCQKPCGSYVPAGEARWNPLTGAR